MTNHTEINRFFAASAQPCSRSGHLSTESNRFTLSSAQKPVFASYSGNPSPL
jgi:hypothetical protein